jgi:hypothetical protein
MRVRPDILPWTLMPVLLCLSTIASKMVRSAATLDHLTSGCGSAWGFQLLLIAAWWGALSRVSASLSFGE